MRLSLKRTMVCMVAITLIVIAIPHLDSGIPSEDDHARRVAVKMERHAERLLQNHIFHEREDEGGIIEPNGDTNSSRGFYGIPPYKESGAQHQNIGVKRISLSSHSGENTNDLNILQDNAQNFQIHKTITDSMIDRKLKQINISIHELNVIAAYKGFRTRHRMKPSETIFVSQEKSNKLTTINTYLNTVLNKKHFEKLGKNKNVFRQLYANMDKVARTVGISESVDCGSPPTPLNNLWGLFEYGKDSICDIYQIDAYRPVRQVMPNLISASAIEDRNWVTFVTHMTADRLESLGLTAKHWKGPISVGIYAKDIKVVQEQWQNSPILRERNNIGVHVMLKQDDEVFYPVNMLRNLALNYSVTEYVYLCDVDLIPAINLDATIMNYIRNGWGNHQALVVPAFEVIKREVLPQYPQNKLSLLQNWAAEKIEPFLFSDFYRSYRATNYSRYITAEEPFQINYEVAFEPYIVIKRNEAPVYHEQFMGYFLNKISYLLEVHIAGFEFVTLPDAFAIHYPHPKGKSQIKYHKRCVQFEFARFVQTLEQKYCVKFTKYLLDLFT